MNTNKNNRDQGFTNDMEADKQRNASRTTQEQDRETQSPRSDDGDRESDLERTDM
jgi:hypothetical protein